MTRSMMREVLDECTFRDWQFRIVEEDGGERLLLQVVFIDADLVTREPSEQSGRKWVMSRFMTKSEVVATAFKAVVTAMEHEVREQFRYRGRMVYGPHLDVDALWEVARKVDVRRQDHEA